MRIKESQLAISALVETQGKLLEEQMAKLDQLEEMLNTNDTNSNIGSPSNSSLLIQNITTTAVSSTIAASNSTAADDNQASTTLGDLPR